MISSIDHRAGRYHGTVTLSRTDGSRLFLVEGNTYPGPEEFLLEVYSEDGSITQKVKCNRGSLQEIDPEETSPGVYTFYLNQKLLRVISIPEPRIIVRSGDTIDINIVLGIPENPRRAEYDVGYAVCYHVNPAVTDSEVVSIYSSLSGQDESRPNELFHTEIVSHTSDGFLVGALTLRASVDDSGRYKGVISCYTDSPADSVMLTVELLPEGENYLTETITVGVASMQRPTEDHRLGFLAGQPFQMLCQALGSPATAARVYFHDQLVTENIDTRVYDLVGFVETQWYIQNPDPSMSGTFSCQGSDSNSMASVEKTLMFINPPEVLTFQIISWDEDDQASSIYYGVVTPTGNTTLLRPCINVDSTLQQRRVPSRRPSFD